MTWQIWLAIASIVFIVFGLVKRLETRMLLIVAGFILCCASGAPMKAFGAFVKGMTNITLVPAICSAMGFAFAVQASKCDQHLVAAVAAPLKKLGGLLIPAATILTFLINIAIMSAAGTAATAGATFIPLLLRAGIRPAAAAAAVGGGTMAGLLLNPGCAHDIYVAKMAEMDLMAFIIWAAPYIVGLVLLSVIVNSAIMIVKNKDHLAGAEAKDAAAKSDAGQQESAFKVQPLKAVAPLVPLIVLLVASISFPKAGIDGCCHADRSRFYLRRNAYESRRNLQGVFQGMRHGIRSSHRPHCCCRRFCCGAAGYGGRNCLHRVSQGVE